ncbi:monooxygenase [Acinetobacter sp. ANC 4558]|uniref:acyl-CoA dehydrogenase family protein n=1 Tax=Acinetobacter sp. ANC 4558 TaxID=1977876 RepID=UPI000A348001|nr:acyl-CoA dehydrogenase family protein [Acinetobacter sp. ANC 4558]OTG87190.1 monooxygenase [Acinetobacter sp. ANC 4558]
MSTQDIEYLSNTEYDKLISKFRPIFQRIADGALEREKSRILPYDPIKWLKKAGFGAVRVPREFGGGGVSQKQLFKLLIELAAADSNVVQALRGHFAFVEDRLNAHLTESQQIWFERFVQGDIVGNAWTEIGKVEIGDVKTRITAEEHTGNLFVNGRKYYSTGTIYADWIDLFALDETTNQHVIAAVSTVSKGVQVLDDWNGFGQKTTGSGTLTIQNVEITREFIFPFEQRFKYQTAFYQVVHLATLTGIAQSAVERFTEEVRSRTRIYSHGNAELIREDAQILQIIGKASAQAFAAESITLTIAEALDQAYFLHVKQDSYQELQANDHAELLASQGQVVISESVLNLTTDLFNALGASASTSEKQLDRFWRNARVISSHNPVIYKQKVIGDWIVNQTPLPYVWQIGNSPAAKQAEIAI